MGGTVKVFCYHQGSNGVSHYRVWSPYKYLGRIDGFEVKRLPDVSDRVQIPMEGESNVPGIGSHDTITLRNDVLVTQYMPAFKDSARIVCQAKLKPLVLDLDDDCLNIEPSNPNYKSWHSHDGQPELIMEIPSGEHQSPEWRTRAAQAGGVIVEREGKWFLVGPEMNFVQNVLEEVKAAGLVTVSTKRLAEIYGRYNDHVAVIPNGIDFEIWGENERKNDGFIRLGLFGSNTHYKDWQEIADVLLRILAEFPKVKLCYNAWFVAGQVQQGASMEEMEKKPQFPDYFEKLGLIHHPQVELYEPVEIQRWPKALANVGIDIGLAPLKHGAFNRSKSNLKYLEFSALGIPGVYEKFDPYQEDVRHGENGFLASQPADWYSCIKRLVLDEGLRQKMGTAARQDVRKRYEQSIISAKLADEVRKLAQRGVRSHEESVESRARRAGLVLAR